MQCEIIRGGQSYTLHVQADDGLGMAPLHRLTERGPMQHGATDIGFRLDPRVFSLVLSMRGTGLTDLYQRRQVLQGWLFPGVTMALRFTRGDGVQRQIDCRVTDAPMPHDVTRVWGAQTIAAQFIAADPTFYDPVSRYINMAETGLTGWTVPMTVPLFVGASALATSYSLAYRGNWRSLPWRILIRGPIENPVLYNRTTNEKLDFTGVELTDSSEWLYIDCRYGYKTVVDETGANRIADLTTDSDLATWHIAPAPIAPGGVNELETEGIGITSDTAVVLNYYERYLGI